MSVRQQRAFQILDDPTVTAVLYGGAKGGGKSVFGCIWLFIKALAVLDKFKLRPSKYPLPLAFMGRKQSVDFNDTTLETWKAMIPEDAYELRVGEKEIIIKDCLKIQYGGLDDTNTIKKFNSAEYAYIFIDQAEEVLRDDYGMLRGTLRQTVNGHPLDYKVLLTANPADCWLRDDFLSGGHVENKFVQALPADNPFLPRGYVDNMKEAYKHRPEMVEAYVYGKWDVIAGFDLAIKPSWVARAMENQLKHNVYEKRIVVCDPARFGDDETVIYVLHGGKLVDQMIYGQRSTTETAGNIARLYKKHRCHLAAVDGCGVGGGVVDMLRELPGVKVLDINSGSKPTTEAAQSKYFNRRAQMWWEAAEMFSKEEVELTRDDILKRQLSAVKYSTDSKGRVRLESKEDVKDRLSGKSPDRGDALVMGLHALNYVPTKQRDFRREPYREERGSYGWNELEALYAK